MLTRKSGKFDYNLNPINRPLKKELNKLKMGCSSSQVAAKGGRAGGEGGAITKSQDGTATIVESVKYPPAEAFVIPLDDDDDNNVEPVESIIKKHPPKRLQRLTEASAASPTTIEDLEEKLARAEVRRKNYIQQKIEGIAILAKSRDLEDENLQTDGGQEDEKVVQRIKFEENEQKTTVDDDDDNDNEDGDGYKKSHNNGEQA